jgi:ATP-binding cassette subfamily B protein
MLVRTLLRYRFESAMSIAGAVVWMAFVVVGPWLIARVIDEAIEPGVRDRLGLLVGLVAVAGVARAASIGWRRFFGFMLAYRAETELRDRIFEHMQRLAFSFHDRVPAGEVMARASTDLSQVRLVFAMLPITVANLAMLLLVVIVMVAMDPVVGGITAITVPLMLVTANLYARRVLKLSWDVQQKLADLNSVVEEAVAGVRVVKAYGQEDKETARLDHVASNIFGKTMQLTRYRSFFVPIFEVIPSLATLVVLWLGGLRVIEGTLTLGDFVAFTQYLTLLVFPLRMTGFFFAQLPRAAAAGSRVMGFLETAPEIDNPPQPEPLPDGPGEVRFHNVRFSYDSGPEVLRGVDLTIPGGTSVALVGSTGSGKSTMSYLIPRFYDVDSGVVTVDGLDVRRASLDEIRGAVALVFEETFLFSATLRENIAFGNPAATDEQVRLAARLAQAHQFISDTPDGYDTMVGERGYSLSGGQRQRIALARAVLRDPRVLILDDATSSVDAITEEEIRSALQTVMAGRTTIIIAHRTSTLTLADRVILLDEGTIRAVGTHAELLETEPRYAEILAESFGAPSGESAAAVKDDR